MATINMLEETANYLLNHCFVLGGVEELPLRTKTIAKVSL